jgi:hypothetical protein
LEWDLERKEILDLTNGLCNAMTHTQNFLLGEANSTLNWTQFVALSTKHTIFGSADSPEEEPHIVGINLIAANDLLNDEKLTSTRRLIQLMISLSWHYYLLY